MLPELSRHVDTVDDAPFQAVFGAHAHVDDAVVNHLYVFLRLGGAERGHARKIRGPERRRAPSFQQGVYDGGSQRVHRRHVYFCEAKPSQDPEALVPVTSTVRERNRLEGRPGRVLCGHERWAARVDGVATRRRRDE